MRSPLHFLPLLLLSCGPSPTPTPDVPVALQPDGVLAEVKSSVPRLKYGADLVGSLFAEELERDPALARLLQELEERQAAHADSMQVLEHYMGKNREFYRSAEQHVRSIGDSLIKGSMLDRWQKDQRRFEDGMKPWGVRMEQYDSLHQRTTDLVTAIKVDRTLAIMRTYQTGNKPDEQLLDREIDRLTSLERELLSRLAL